MMISVIKRHEIIRRLPKLLLLNLVMVTLVGGLITHKHVDSGDGLIISKELLLVVQVFVFLGAAGILELPEAGRRCREWELSLPITGDFWWRSHLFSLILAGLSMMLVYAIIPIGLTWLSAGLDLMQINTSQLMWDLWVLPTLAFLIVVNSFVLMSPGSVQVGRAKGQHLKSLLTLAFMVVMIIVCSWFGLTWIMLIPLAVVVYLNTRRPICVNLELLQGQDGDINICNWEPQEVKVASRRLMHLTVMRLLFKWPVNWVALLPFSLLFGLLLGGFNPITYDPDSMRFSNFFMSIYVLTSACGYFSERQHLVDALPIDRRTILAWLVLPVVVAMGLGYGGGRLIVHNSVPQEPAFTLLTTEEAYIFCVPPRCYQNSPTVEGLEISAPWGETHTGDLVSEHEGLRWHFFNPYSIPRGASERYAAWQIQRAVADVYGEDISAELISERYLSTDSMGIVRVRDEELNIEEDFSLGKAVFIGPVFPFLYGTVVIAYLLVLAINFRALKWMVSVKRQRIVFWSIMALLLGAHLGSTFLTATLNESWIIQGIILGTIHRWSLAQAGAVPIAYGVALLAIIPCWSLVLHHFRRVESPQG